MDLHRRPLLSADNETDWSAQVVSALPQTLQPLVSTATVRVSYGPWSCLAVPEGGTCRLYVWMAGTATTPQEQRKGPVLKLQHEKLEGCEKPLLALHCHQAASASSTAASDNSICWLVCANPETGAVLVYKLQTPDFSKMLPPRCTAMTICDLEEDDSQQDTLACLTLDWPRLALGTVHGHVFTGHARAVVPTALVLSRVLKSSATASIFSSLFTPSKSRRRRQQQEEAMVGVVWTSETTGLGVSETGHVVAWSGGTWSDTTHDSLLEQLQAYLKTVVVQALQVQAVTTVTSTATSTRAVHVLVHATVQENASTPTKRLYWLVLKDDASLQEAHWINRIVDPTQVKAHLVGTVNQAYTVLTDTKPAVVLCLHQHETNKDIDRTTTVLQEVDLAHQITLADSVAPDLQSTGVTVWDTSGVALRVRCRRRDDTAPSASAPAALVATLASHLKSAFWQAYSHPEIPPALPPSVVAASKSDFGAVEQALLKTAQQLADVPTTTTTAAQVLEWHMTLLRVLVEQTGLGRSLSHPSRWRLLAIGQQVAVAQALEAAASSSSTSAWQQAQWARLHNNNSPTNNVDPSLRISCWLEQVQQSALQAGSPQDANRIFLDWLLIAMEAAMTFRAEKAYLYDVSPNKLPVVESPDKVPVWTSQTPLLQIWTKQLAYWQSQSSQSSQQSRGTMLSMESLKKASQYALLSFGDAYESCRSAATKLAYVTAQKVTIDLVRRMIPQDAFCFELCRAHKYFHGICKIAMDQEGSRGRRSRNSDNNDDKTVFDLTPLLTEMASVRDTESNLPFPAYCIKWHADRKFFGHALTYGKTCPEVLAQLINNMESLKPFKWIYAIRQGDYEGATVSLMQNVDQQETLSATRLTLNIARITNRIVQEEVVSSSSAQVTHKRRRLLEKQSEVCDAQETILGKATSDSSPVRSRETLLQYALDQLMEKQDNEDRLELAVTALALCSTFEADRDVRQAAARVWARILEVDQKVWQGLVQGETVDLTSPRNVQFVRKHTLFGAVLAETRDYEAWVGVGFDADMQGRVWEEQQLQHAPFATGLLRLLRSVTATEADNKGGIVGESLVAHVF